MEWTRSETLALAQANCSTCYGTGVRSIRRGQTNACHCVYRAIFRACYARFRDCTTKEKFLSQVSMEYTSHGGHRIWGRKDEEYIADFTLVSRRSLSPEEYQLFSFHFLLGADWRLCCRRMNMDRGTFFHAIYKLQEKLGRIFRELRPYALYPLDEYFNGRIENSWTPDSDPFLRAGSNRTPLRPCWVLDQAA